MNTEQPRLEHHQISVSGLRVEIVRKDIKNLHLGVYPPNGRVRVAAPRRVSDDAVRLAVIGKLAWIKKHRARFEAQPRQSRREMVGGESHYYLGKRYRLRVVACEGAGKVILRNVVIELHARAEASAEYRGRILERWYRERLRELIPALLEKWQKVMGVSVAEWGIKRMKTRWGTCNPVARRIWVNLELVKKPVQCLEYIVVHELAHLIERRHDARFIAIMDEHLPKWRGIRAELNAAPLGHEGWGY